MKNYLSGLVALLFSISAFSQTWVNVENSSIKIPGQINTDLSVLHPYGCTYNTTYESPAVAEAKANAFVAGKTDIFVNSMELITEYVVTDWGTSYPVYYYQVNYIRAFGKCY